MTTISFEVEPAEEGERIDVVLTRHAGVTRALAQRAVRTGAVTVDGGVVRPSHRVSLGESIAGRMPRPEVAPPVAEDIPVAIRYDGPRVLVVSKPAGLVTHPARGHSEGTLVNALLNLGIPLAGTETGTLRPGIVHRLDKDTSGLLLVAKDDAAQAFLVDALRRREVERTYLALVRGSLGSTSGTVEAPVGRHPSRRTRMAVVADGRPSVTHFRTLATTEGATLLQVRLETGRTHQIRVHMAHLGHPVLGDRTYGGHSDRAVRWGLTRPFLHAIELRFPAPDPPHDPVEIRDEVPGDLAAVLAAAGLEPPRA